MSQYYPPCIAPTGEHNTCLVCGIKLKNVQMWFINIVRFSDATEEQKANWPHRRTRIWNHDENAYVWRKEPMYQQHFDDPRTLDGAFGPLGFVLKPAGIWNDPPPP